MTPAYVHAGTGKVMGQRVMRSKSAQEQRQGSTIDPIVSRETACWGGDESTLQLATVLPVATVSASTTKVVLTRGERSGSPRLCVSRCSNERRRSGYLMRGLDPVSGDRRCPAWLAARRRSGSTG